MRLSLAAAGAVFVSLLASADARAREGAEEFVKRGDELLEKGEFEKAVKEYDRALKLDAKDVRAYLGRGAARSASGDPFGAARDFSEAVALDPQEPRAYYGRARVRAQLGQYEK